MTSHDRCLFSSYSVKTRGGLEDKATYDTIRSIKASEIP
jgi:hypothetical protein